MSYIKFVQSLASRSGQQPVVSTKTVIGTAGVIAKHDEEGELLYLFGIKKSASMCYTFLDYKLYSDNNYILEGASCKLHVWTPESGLCWRTFYREKLVARIDRKGTWTHLQVTCSRLSARLLYKL